MVSYRMAWAVLAFASSVACAGLRNPFPAGRIYSSPIGILYPSINTAAAANPAALATQGKASALQVAVSPKTVDSRSEGFASLAVAHNDYGVSLGYIGNYADSQKTHGAFGGFAYSLDPISIGIGGRDSNLENEFSPAVDIGLLLDRESVTLGGVLYSINGNTQLAVGLGTRSGKKYNIELNALLPPFDDVTRGYVFTAATSVFTEWFGVHFRTSLYTAWESFDHTVALGSWLGESVFAAVQYSTYQRITGSLTFDF